MLIFLQSIKLDEIKAVARTFMGVSSKRLIKM